VRRNAEPLLVPPDELTDAVYEALEAVRRERRAKGLKKGVKGKAPRELEPYKPLNIPPGVLFFASGASNPGEVAGYADLGFGVGTSALKCSYTRCEEAYYQLAFMREPPPGVFLDNGAYSEYKALDKLKKATTKKAKKEARELVAETKLTTRRLEEVVSFYERVAERLGPRMPVYVVAPDKIADQKATIKRMNWAADRLIALRRRRSLDVRLLVPVQKGDAGQVAFYDRIKRIFGQNVIPALPMREGVTSEEEVAEFLKARGKGLRGIHFLGLGPPRVPPGPKGKKALRVLGLVSQLAPGVPVSIDAGLHRAIAGWGKKEEFDPRAWTHAQVIAGKMLEWEMSPRFLESVAVWTKEHGWAYFDETEEIGSPEDWLLKEDGKPTRALREFAYMRVPEPSGPFQFTKEERSLLLKDPRAFLYSPVGGPYCKPGEEPVRPKEFDECWFSALYDELRMLWWEVVRAKAMASTSATKKRYGLHYALAQSAAGAASLEESLPQTILEHFAQYPLFEKKIEVKPRKKAKKKAVRKKKAKKKAKKTMRRHEGIYLPW
jgi:hypothetical protein